MSSSVLLAIVLGIVALYVAPKLATALEQTAIGRGFLWTIAGAIAGLIYLTLIALIVFMTLGLRSVLFRS